VIWKVLCETLRYQPSDSSWHAAVRQLHVSKTPGNLKRIRGAVWSKRSETALAFTDEGRLNGLIENHENRRPPFRLSFCSTHSHPLSVTPQKEDEKMWFRQRSRIFSRLGRLKHLKKLLTALSIVWFQQVCEAGWANKPDSASPRSNRRLPGVLGTNRSPRQTMTGMNCSE